MDSLKKASQIPSAINLQLKQPRKDQTLWDGRIYALWHTQGSGKSISMAIYVNITYYLS
jgi:type I site-specific restriction-modification system R (restriction) subunit